MMQIGRLFRRSKELARTAPMPWELRLLLCDLEEVAGIHLPRISRSELVRYDPRMAWVDEVVRSIQEAALDNGD